MDTQYGLIASRYQLVKQNCSQLKVFLIVEHGMAFGVPKRREESMKFYQKKYYK